jgi:hypothetical protein
MVRRSQNPSSPRDLKLFSEAEDPSLVSKQFWAQILKYRPLFLLGALWFSLICISAVAYSRLMFTGVSVSRESVTATETLRQTPSQATIGRTEGVEVEVQKSDTASNGRATIEGAEVDGSATDETAEADRSFNWVSVWGLLSLVSFCALGSFMIAQQAKAPPRKPKPRKKRLVNKAKVPQPAALEASAVRRLDPYSPERDNIVVPGGAPAVTEGSLADHRFESPSLADPMAETPNKSFMAANGALLPDQSAHGATALSPQPGSTVLPPQLNRVQRTASVQPPQLPRQAAEAELHEPAIVPDSEDHPLDWSEASIAHTLDLRQRRALSSFL